MAANIRPHKSLNSGRFKKPVAKKPSQRKPSVPASDLAARRKIGASLDVAAFLSHHIQNSVSLKHWETKE